MLVFEVCLDKIMASVMRYPVKGQERDSHAVLTVGELGILQLMVPSAKKQAPSSASEIKSRSQILLSATFQL